MAEMISDAGLIWIIQMIEIHCSRPDDVDIVDVVESIEDLLRRGKNPVFEIQAWCSNDGQPHIFTLPREYLE